MIPPRQFVYHLVPRKLQGNSLYPLRLLQEIVPELAKTYAQKYEGREFLQSRPVPPLDCFWPDVIMFSPVHPQHIMELFRKEGYDLKTRKWFEVPLSRLEPENTAVFFSRLRPYGDYSFADDDFVMLTQVDFASLTQSTAELQRHVQIGRAENRKPLMFMGIPHILYKGVLPLDDINIVEF